MQSPFFTVLFSSCSFSWQTRDSKSFKNQGDFFSWQRRAFYHSCHEILCSAKWRKSIQDWEVIKVINEWATDKPFFLSSWLFSSLLSSDDFHETIKHYVLFSLRCWSQVCLKSHSFDSLDKILSSVAFLLRFSSCHRGQLCSENHEIPRLFFALKNKTNNIAKRGLTAGVALD